MSAASRFLLVLCGPTASGKTGLALALSKNLPLRLISADSMQVYKGMDIGTAKPEGPERGQFALLDVVEPGEGFSAGRFAAMAGAEAEAAWTAGKIPCVVGGTGLYLQALLHGLAEIPAIPTEIREAVSRQSPEALLEELESQDPQTAEKIELQNPRRVQRAVEVLRSTGKGLSAWHAQGKSGALTHDKLLILGLNPSPEILDNAIAQRLQLSLKRGWLDECQALVKQYGEAALRSTGAIGYGELLDLSLPEAAQKIQERTRQYARRQRTWFKRDKEIVWLESPDPEAALKRIQLEI